jgi:hypothetical protein
MIYLAVDLWFNLIKEYREAFIEVDLASRDNRQTWSRLENLNFF